MTGSSYVDSFFFLGDEAAHQIQNRETKAERQEDRPDQVDEQITVHEDQLSVNGDVDGADAYGQGYLQDREDPIAFQYRPVLPQQEEEFEAQLKQLADGNSA